MARDQSSLRIGVVDHTESGWLAAAVYSRMILRSLESACAANNDELYFLSSTGNEHALQSSKTKSIQLGEIDYLPAERALRKLLRLSDKEQSLRGEPRLRKLLRLNSKADVFRIAQENRIDVLLPLLDLPPWTVATKTIGWIPDFQHRHLPQFFPKADLQHRDATIRRLGEHAKLVMLSSNAALSDFADFDSTFAQKARVVPFPSLLAFEALPQDPIATRRHFNLPEKFALIANQFWAHKNHLLVVRALNLLVQRGLEITVVMTGQPSDHRDPSNKNLSLLFQEIAAAGLNKHVIILGLVPHADLINLMRTAALIIQPSRFEGWSTIVQDALALGRPLLCSDIAVHREQAPSALGFFGCDEVEELATLIERHWPNLKAGPDEELETHSIAAEQNFSQTHGQMLLQVCAEAASL